MWLFYVNVCVVICKYMCGYTKIYVLLIYMYINLCVWLYVNMCLVICTYIMPGLILIYVAILCKSMCDYILYMWLCVNVRMGKSYHMCDYILICLVIIITRPTKIIH